MTLKMYHIKKSTSSRSLKSYCGSSSYISFKSTKTFFRKETILRTLHEQETKADVFSFAQILKPLSDETYDKAAEKLLRELYLVVKDHDNNAVLSCKKDVPILLMTGAKNNSDKHLVVTYLYHFEMNRFPDTPLNLVVVNERDYGDPLQGVYMNASEEMD